MGKYEPLTDFLRRQARDEVRMSFGDIERVIGVKLPQSSTRHRAWWSNNPSNSVMTKAWIDAGFRSEQVDIEGRTLVFRRVSSATGEKPTGVRKASTEDRSASHERHPLIGWMKSTVHVAPRVDLTQPADSDWGDRA